MSRKERARLVILAGVKAAEVTLVAAADLMGLCYRQAKRLWRRYQDQGDAGLVHRLRGQPGARRKPPALRAQVLARYEDKRYADFGPTFAQQVLHGAGCWPKGNGKCGAGGKRIGNGGNASPALGQWYNWTARTTTGSKGGAASAC